MPATLTDGQVDQIWKRFSLMTERLSKLASEQPNHTLITRMAYDWNVSMEQWAAMMTPRQEQPTPQEDAGIVDLIEALQDELPTASITIMIPPQPRQ